MNIMRRVSKHRMLTAACLGVLALAASLWVSFAIRAQQLPVPPAKSGGSATARPEVRDKNIERLKDQIKMLEIHYIFGPAAVARKEDYAQARRGFHTKLTRKGPSPSSGRRSMHLPEWPKSNTVRATFALRRG